MQVFKFRITYAVAVSRPDRRESAAWSTEGRSFCKSIIFMFS